MTDKKKRKPLTQPRKGALLWFWRLAFYTNWAKSGTWGEYHGDKLTTHLLSVALVDKPSDTAHLYLLRFMLGPLVVGFGWHGKKRVEA